MLFILRSVVDVFQCIDGGAGDLREVMKESCTELLETNLS